MIFNHHSFFVVWQLLYLTYDDKKVSADKYYH